MTEDYTIERNRQPRIDSMAQLFDLTLESKTPELFLTQEELSNGEKFIDKEKFNIVFCMEAVGARRRIKRNLLIKRNKKLYYCTFKIICSMIYWISCPPARHIIVIMSSSNSRSN